MLIAGDCAYVDMSSRSMVLDENAENNVLTFTYSRLMQLYGVHCVDAQTGEQITPTMSWRQTLNLQNVSARELMATHFKGDACAEYVLYDSLMFFARTLKHLLAR